MGGIEKLPFLGLTSGQRIEQGQNRGVAVQPRVAAVSTSNQFGISIPGQIGYVSDEGGNQVSLGQDGVGLAHRNPRDFNFMAIG